MSLFGLGDFVLASGTKSDWKIDCDHLSDEDIKSCAILIRKLVGGIDFVFGVPRGGIRLADAVRSIESKPPAQDDGEKTVLLVDDVWTTGRSMMRFQALLWDMGSSAFGRHKVKDPVGVVLFARGPCPKWVKPLFTVNQKFWVNDDSLWLEGEKSVFDVVA